STTRRTFLQQSATAAAAVAAVNVFKTPVYGQNQAPSSGRVIGANDRIVVGFVGVGGQGMAHVRSMKEHAGANNVSLAAVADVSKHRVAEAQKTIGGDCAGFEDYRKMMERTDIDAIVCSTVDHWHTRVCVDSMNTGKHVYVEKPMTRYLGEAFEIYDACKRTGKLLQVGSQGCSDLKWHKAASLIKDGRIGPVVMSQGSYMRNAPKGEWNYGIQKWATADDINWNLWLGNQIKTRQSFDADHYFRWRKYFPYCSGLLGDLFPHKLHPYMLATGNPQFPVRVAAVGSRKVETDKNTPGTYMRDVAEIIQLIAEFPDGMVMHITSATVNEMGTQEMIRGHKATLTMQGNRVVLTPERSFSEEVEAATFDSMDGKPFVGEPISVHEKNWFDSIRTNKQPNAGIDLAVKVQTVISLAEMSDRMNMMCLFNEKTRKVTDANGKEVAPPTYGNVERS
ncbi:MAG: Gfo/Idh/MocA family oxidoreductase, partial [Verrucomicrobia bacterium]|nr:Gfo/Idh/MocA family oxidoreductase [Verrucomicrobiota bacterium]